MIRSRGVLFLHLPKNAGTSICHQLYGRQVKHASVAYYAKAAPDVLKLPSFAIIRDPVDRFLSAYQYARRGGTGDRRVSDAFHDHYRRFQTIDDAIQHLANARSPFDVDHIFRPQSWYLTDKKGRNRIDILVPHNQITNLSSRLGINALASLPLLNCSEKCVEPINAEQMDFLKRFHADDFKLFAEHCRDSAF